MKELIVTVPVVGITSAQISIQMEGVIVLDTIVKQLLCCQVAISSNQQKNMLDLLKWFSEIFGISENHHHKNVTQNLYF